MIRIGEYVFVNPSKWEPPNENLDYKVQETQGGQSFSESSFFNGKGKMEFNGLKEEDFEKLRKIEDDFLPVCIKYEGYNKNCLIQIEHEPLLYFREYRKVVIEFVEVGV